MSDQPRLPLEPERPVGTPWWRQERPWHICRPTETYAVALCGGEGPLIRLSPGDPLLDESPIRVTCPECRRVQEATYATR